MDPIRSNAVGIVVVSIAVGGLVLAQLHEFGLCPRSPLARRVIRVTALFANFAVVGLVIVRFAVIH